MGKRMKVVTFKKKNTETQEKQKKDSNGITHLGNHKQKV